MRAVAVLAIDGYQRFISPYKGFRCAHNVLYGLGGCSSYGRQVILQNGVLQGWALLRKRFAECKVAALKLQAMAAAPQFGKRTSDETEEERKRRKKTDWCNCGDLPAPSNCGSPRTSSGGPSNCDGMPSLDCSPPVDAIDACSVGDACACSF